MATQFFHTRDPIANLRVCVTVRKVAVGDSRDGDALVGAAWHYTFHWQEKQWPFAARKTTKPKAKKNATPSDADTAAAAAMSSSSAHHGIALCSYVDADNYAPRRYDAPTTSLAPPPHIVAAAADVHQSQTTAGGRRSGSHELAKPSVGTSNHDRVALRAHREETFRQMHLVLRITNNTHGTDEDLVLASLRYYPHTGLLCMTPGFSACIIDDKDVDAMEKGPKLSTYRVLSRATGANFEYALDNENELCPVVSSEDQRLLRELQRQEDLEDSARLDEWRNKHGDMNPFDATTTLPNRPVVSTEKAKTEAEDQTMVLLEVVSVSGVHSPDPIRVSVDLIVPDSATDSSAWGICSGSQSSKTRLSRVTMCGEGHAFAAFGFHTQFVLSRAKATVTATRATQGSTPPLKLAVVSQDTWGRERLLGQTEMRLPLAAGFTDTDVSLWRPVAGPREEMEAFFIGSDADYADHALTTTTAVNASKSILSRLGMQTESTNGHVRVRLHIVHSRPQTVTKSLAPNAPLSLVGIRAPQSGSVLKRSVEEILQSVKASQRHSSIGRGGGALSVLPLSSSQSVTAILARLNNHGTSPSAG